VPYTCTFFQLLLPLNKKIKTLLWAPKMLVKLTSAVVNLIKLFSLPQLKSQNKQERLFHFNP
jgi:hypothetical protein